MICSQCGEEMRMTEKDTSSGRDFREYECSRCGHTDWEDRGSAFWKILSEFNEEFREIADNAEPVHTPGNLSEPLQAQPVPQPPLQPPPQPPPRPQIPQPEAVIFAEREEFQQPAVELWNPEPEPESEWKPSLWDRFGSWMGWGR